MAYQIIPFEDSLLSQAADLLAARHARDRVVLRGLPARFEDAAVARQAIEAIRAKPHATGFAAMDGERLAGYLIGDVAIDSQRGRSGWVRNPGCAYDPRLGPEAIRHLYAALGEIWVGNGVFAHYALLSCADDALLRAWYSLSFGLEQVHGLLKLARYEAEHPGVPGIELRLSGPGDESHLSAISDVIWREQVQAPAWGAMLPETVAEVKEGWAELAADADYVTWLALDGEEAVGVQVYWPAETSDETMHVPEQCVHLGVAGTRTHQRGRGIGSWMTAHGLAQAAEAGYQQCETDWRSTNLLSSRFWPQRGFRPVVYRLVRHIDARIAWATGK